MKRRKSDERGAALFVIVLVVSLLTAIGVFAMHATSLAQLGAGYSRRAATAQYLAEFAGNHRAATIADTVDNYVDIGLGKYVDKALPRPQQNNCLLAKDLLPLLSPPEIPYCVPYDSGHLALDAKRSNASVGSDPEGFFGALNRPDAPTDQLVTGLIRIESLDHTNYPRPIPGFPATAMSSNGSANYQDSLFVTGTLQPAAAVSDMCTAPVTRASETDRVTGIVVYPQITAHP